STADTAVASSPCPTSTPTPTPTATPTPTPVTYQVTGNVFIDTYSNQNGIKDGAEVNYTAGGATVSVSTAPVTTVPVNASGTYLITGLTAGVYNFSINPPAGFLKSAGTVSPVSKNIVAN